MSFYVNISYGSAGPSIRTVSPKAVAIIGKTAVYSGVAYNVQSLDELSGIVSSDPLYTGVEAALALMPADTMIIAAGVVGTGTVHSDSILTRGPDYYYSEYSPISSYSNVEIYVSDSGAVQISGLAAGMYDVTSGLTWEQDGPYYTGVVTVNDDGLELSSGAVVICSGYYPIADDILRADLNTPAISEVFKELSSPKYRFQYFVFAYPSLPTPTDPAPTDDFKYASGYCISDQSWIMDLILGASLAKQFNRQNQRTQFIMSLPHDIYPDTNLGNAYGAGIFSGSFSPSSIVQMISSEYAIITTANLVESGAYDTAIQMAATRLGINPRRSTLFLAPPGPTLLARTIPQSVINKWRAARINVIAPGRASDAPVWHGNYTTSFDRNLGSINYMQVIGLLAYDIEMAIYSLLYSTRPLKYDMDGMIAIEDVIKTVCELYVSKGYIDGYIGTDIPIKSLIAKEGSLTEGEQSVLDQARASGVIDNVTVRFYWAGDVETINLTIIGGGLT